MPSVISINSGKFMKTFILAATSGIALTTATPALAADMQDSAVETVDVEMSDERKALALAAVDAYWPAGQGQHMVNYFTNDYADFILYTPLSVMAEEFGLKEVIGSFAANMGDIEAMFGDADEEDMGATEDGDGMSDDEASEETDEMPSQEEIEAMADMMIAMFGDQTVASMIEAKDEHFEERVAIFRDVVQTELEPLFAKMEPVLRDTYAEMFAERFTDAELADIAAFAQTEGGRKYARDQWLFAFDPTYWKAIFLAVPESMSTFPDLMKTMEERMAHLPPFGGEGEEDAEVAEEEAIAEEAYEMSAEDLIAEAEELETYAEELMVEAAELRAQAAELETE